MELARKWARLGGWLGIIWPCLFIGIMIVAESVGAGMFPSRYFGRLWGLSGILISAFLFTLDIWTAPNPAEPDLSILALIWVVAVSIQMVRKSRR